MSATTEWRAPSRRRRGTAAALATAVLAGLCAAGTAAPVHAADAESVTATVEGTGGDNLIVRSTPGTGGAEVKRLAPGTSVEIECQAVSDDVQGNDVWNYLPSHGGYASDFYLATPGHDGRHPDLPLCAEEEPPAGDIRERIVDLAEGEIGLTDKSKYGAPWDHDWCQYFVNWVWRNAGVEDMNDTHFTGDFYYWGKERGLTRDGHEGIEVGDGVLFGTGPENSDTGRHVGIVVQVNSDGSIVSVDGNYSDAVTRVGPYFPETAQTHEPESVYAVVSPPGG
jgi:hypothetical protein